MFAFAWPTMWQGVCVFMCVCWGGVVPTKTRHEVGDKLKRPSHNSQVGVNVAFLMSIDPV